MGNTILAHVLYSCNQVDIDLENFFSTTGNAHSISKLSTSKLIAYHLLEFPNNDLNCVLQLISTNWEGVLRFKMSYDKWYKESPNLSNWNKFFDNKIVLDLNSLWNDFYQTFKDPSWPQCESYELVSSLPTYMQTEIYENYTVPVVEITNNQTLVEFLTLCYYKYLNDLNNQERNGTPIYNLNDYLNNNTLQLQQLADKLGWKWNKNLSDLFYKKVIEVNKQYFDWLEKIKSIHNGIIQLTKVDYNLDVWELALVLAKVCLTLDKNPSTIQWQYYDCISFKDTIQLSKLFKE